LREIANELNVATILEGSVRKSGNRVRVVAQLIDAHSDKHLWVNTYDKELTEIFAIQSNVAQSIAAELKAKLSPDVKERLEQRATENLDAYTLLLRGRYHLNKRLPDDLKKSIEFFKQAIDKDPNYALAYAGLADAYTLLSNYDIMPPAETYGPAKAAAQTALTIDGLLAEAHTSLAFVKMHHEWDWVGAEAEFKRAIELNPSYATAYSWYGIFLAVMGRFTEADEVMQRALSLDPRSIVIHADAGLLLYFSRHYKGTTDHYTKTLAMNPAFAAAYIPLGGAYVQMRMYADAIEALQKASIFSNAHPVAVAALWNCYAAAGQREDAFMMLELLLERRSGEYVPPYWIGVVYAGLGVPDSALTWLEKAYDEHDGSLVFLKVEPALDPLRSDPRFSS
ncbi:MAG: tetratricopeptide repeat protein, partial [Bacteroidota bacterium]